LFNPTPPERVALNVSESAAPSAETVTAFVLNVTGVSPLPHVLAPFVAMTDPPFRNAAPMSPT
jgi:hypothetical protein